MSSHFVKALPYNLLIHVAVAFLMNKTSQNVSLPDAQM